MRSELINPRKFCLVVLLLSLVLLLCAAPAAGAFLTITKCPETVNQEAVLTVTGDAPGVSTLKLTVSGLSIQTVKPIVLQTTVGADDSYSFSIDTSSLPEGQYQIVITPEAFEKGQQTSFDLSVRASFSVLNLGTNSKQPSQSYIYNDAKQSLTATIDKTTVESGDEVTISITSSGTSEIEYILIGESYWEYNYFETPDNPTILNLETSDLPLGKYVAYIIHPKNDGFDVRADNNELRFKGYYGSSFEDLYGLQGENRIDAYLKQANDLYQKLTFTIVEKKPFDYTLIVVIAVILGGGIIIGMIVWIVVGVRKNGNKGWGKLDEAYETIPQNMNTSCTSNTEQPAKRAGSSAKKEYCPYCGKRINPGDMFCSKCGRKLT